MHHHRLVHLSYHCDEIWTARIYDSLRDRWSCWYCNGFYWHKECQLGMEWCVTSICSLDYCSGHCGCFGAILFLFTKYSVLTKRTAVKRAFYSIPFYTFLTVGSLTSESMKLHIDLSANNLSVDCVERSSQQRSVYTRPRHRHSRNHDGGHSLTGLLHAAIFMDADYARRLDFEVVSHLPGSVAFVPRCSTTNSSWFCKTPYQKLLSRASYERRARLRPSIRNSPRVSSDRTRSSAESRQRRRAHPSSARNSFFGILLKPERETII